MTRRADHADAAALLAAAFVDDPVAVHAQPGRDRRRRTLATLFRGVLHRCDAIGGVERVIADDGTLAAVCCWVPSVRLVLSPVELLRAGLWRIVLPTEYGPAATLREARHEHTTDRVLTRHAGDDVAYLWVLGADPDRHGAGYGRRAFEAGLAAMADRGFERCLLKTEVPRNVTLYQHLGFDVVDEVTPPSSGVHSWVFARAI